MYFIYFFLLLLLLQTSNNNNYFLSFFLPASLLSSFHSSSSNLLVSGQAFTYQSVLKVSEAGYTYGQSPVGLYGRGFVTALTGYSSDKADPGIYVHTTDDGRAGRGYFVWTQQAKLKPRDADPQDNAEFGKWMVSYNLTLLVSSPLSDEARGRDTGAVYVFNGTRRHWTQVQKLVAIDGDLNDQVHTGRIDGRK